MKKVALLCMGLAFGAANVAQAQLTMQMSNGWTFTFAGNVNAFYIYQNLKNCAGSTCTTAAKDLSVGTGLLPAFAVFDAKGKEDNLDLGVHFGFAPQVETGGHFGSFFGTQAAGAQIDMRQVYLTAGGTWGSLLMGKELGVYQRGNILTDMTLLGVGVGGGGRGTALGRIGYGYLYTDFRPQLTYTSPAGRRPSPSVSSRASPRARTPRSSCPGSRASSTTTPSSARTATSSSS
jgi:porin-like protein